jgi:hypothetical protein
MNKSKASRRAREAKHVRLYLYTLKAPAWLSLSCQAKCLLIELMALYNGTNNGQLYMSVRTAATLLRTGTKQASAALRELQEKGFIRATRKGSMTRRGEERLATCWRLTEYDDDLTGRQPTKEFMTWRPGEKNSTVVPENTHRSPREHGSPDPDPEMALNRSPREHVQAAFEASTVFPENTQLVNHVEPLKKSSSQPRTAPPSAGPCAQSADASQPRGSRRAKAEWLRDLLDEGLVTTDAVASALAIGPDEVGEIAEGKVGLGSSSWQKLAALVASRVN